MFQCFISLFFGFNVDQKNALYCFKFILCIIRSKNYCLRFLLKLLILQGWICNNTIFSLVNATLCISSLALCYAKTSKIRNVSLVGMKYRCLLEPRPPNFRDFPIGANYLCFRNPFKEFIPRFWPLTISIKNIDPWTTSNQNIGLKMEHLQHFSHSASIPAHTEVTWIVIICHKRQSDAPLFRFSVFKWFHWSQIMWHLDLYIHGVLLPASLTCSAPLLSGS